MAPPLLKARPVVAEFSRQVRARRLAVGLTQGQLAERTYVRVAFIGLIERGKANPSLVTMALLALALDCDVRDLLSQPNAATAQLEAAPL